MMSKKIVLKYIKPSVLVVILAVNIACGFLLSLGLFTAVVSALYLLTVVILYLAYYEAVEAIKTLHSIVKRRRRDG